MSPSSFSGNTLRRALIDRAGPAFLELSSSPLPSSRSIAITELNHIDEFAGILMLRILTQGTGHSEESRS